MSLEADNRIFHMVEFIFCNCKILFLVIIMLEATIKWKAWAVSESISHLSGLSTWNPENNISSLASSLPHERTSNDLTLALCLLGGHVGTLALIPQTRPGPSAHDCHTDPCGPPIRIPKWPRGHSSVHPRLWQSMGAWSTGSALRCWVPIPCA